MCLLYQKGHAFLLGKPTVVILHSAQPVVLLAAQQLDVQGSTLKKRLGMGKFRHFIAGLFTAKKPGTKPLGEHQNSLLTGRAFMVQRRGSYA